MNPKFTRIVGLGVFITILSLFQCSDEKPRIDELIPVVPHDHDQDKDPAKNQIIIKFAPNTDPKTVLDIIQFYRDQSVTVTECYCGSNLILLDFPDTSIDPEERRKSVTETLAQQGDELSRVGNNVSIFLDVIPGIYQSGPNTTDETLPSHTNPVVVAVIDGGIIYYDDAFRDKLWVNPESEACEGFNYHGFDFTLRHGDLSPELNRHGSLVAAVIAKYFPLDYAQLQLMDLRIFDRNGASNLFDALCATYYAMDHGADVINMSWGYYHHAVDSLLLDALAEAESREIAVVTSAGNNSINTDADLHFPSGFTHPDYELKNMLSVGALKDDRSALADYSNYGTFSVDLYTPVSEVVVLEGRYIGLMGTSFAAPQTTRLLAGLLGSDHSLDKVDCIIAHSDDLSTPTGEYKVMNELRVTESCLP